MERFCQKVPIVGLLLALLTGVTISKETQYAQYRERTAIEGSSVKLKCTNLDNDGSSITPSLNSAQTIDIWSVNGSLPRGSKYKLLTDGLVIRNVSKEDASANYTCTILDRFTFTPLRSANIILKLRQRTGKFLESSILPEPVTEKKVRVWGIVNQWVKLQCNIFSRPSPTFEWRKQDSEDKIHDSSNLYKIMEDESSSNLTIFVHNETFFGEYICKASNIHGESMQHFILVKGYKPKSPFIYPTFIITDRLTLKVEPQEIFRSDVTSYKEALPLTSYLIQYMEVEGLSTAAGRFHSTNKKWTTITKTADGMGIFELRNLKKNMTYLVRCAVANVAAISDFSPAVRITTDAYENDESTGRNTTKGTTVETLTPRREDYGRSSNYEPENLTLSIGSPQQKNPTVQADCETPRYKKTIIRTTTSTTVIEHLQGKNENNGNETSPLVKKQVIEDTAVERMFLCSI